MTITFESLTVTDTAAAGRTRMLFGSRGFGRELVADEGAGRSRIAFDSRGYGDMEDGEVAPIIPAHGISNLFFDSVGEGAETVDIEGSGASAVAFRSRGYGLVVVAGDIPGAGLTRVEFASRGRGMATGAAYGFFVERPAVVTGYGGLQFITMEDQFKVGGVAAGTPIHVLHTGMDFGIDAAARSEVMMILRAGVAFETGLALVFRELIAIGLRLDSTGTETSTAVEHMADALLLAGVVSDYAEALTTIADALVFGTVAQSRLMNTMTDAAVFGDAVSDAMTAVEQMLDGLLIAAEPNDTATMAVLMADTLAINAAGSQSLEVHNVLRDGLDFVLRMNVDNGEYIAYTINTESRAATKYTQYPFNSFAKINGRQRGATDTGIFKMGGDTDDGEPIAARLRLGLSSLGTQIVKRMPAAYMGYSASGDLFVKVVTASTIDGEREANVYRLIVRAANTTREGRVPFGPGIKSVYYDFVIENIDENGAGGADFALDMIEFFPLLTTRRIRGDSSGKR